MTLKGFEAEDVTAFSHATPDHPAVAITAHVTTGPGIRPGDRRRSVRVALGDADVAFFLACLAGDRRYASALKAAGVAQMQHEEELAKASPAFRVHADHELTRRVIDAVRAAVK